MSEYIMWCGCEINTYSGKISMRCKKHKKGWRWNEETGRYTKIKKDKK